jgi:hypothetical protein
MVATARTDEASNIPVANSRLMSSPVLNAANAGFSTSLMRDCTWALTGMPLVELCPVVTPLITRVRMGAGM